MARHSKGADRCAQVTKLMSIGEFLRGYVTGDYPGLCGYAYNADLISIGDAERIMERILDETVCVDDSGPYPVLVQRDGKGLHAQDTDDFPQPTDDCEGYDVED